MTDGKVILPDGKVASPDEAIELRNVSLTESPRVTRAHPTLSLRHTFLYSEAGCQR
jgi:hypothetical protein